MKQEEQHKESEPEMAANRGGNPLAWIAMAVGMLSLAVTAGFYWTSTHHIDRVEYEGHYFVSVEDLQNVEVPTGLSPDSMNFVKIINEFEQIPFVKRAALNVEPGGKLVVELMERQPLAMLVDGKQRMYVDGEGIQLPRILNKQVDVPLLYGFAAGAAGDTLQSESFSSALEFLKELQNKPVTNATISEVVWSGQEGVVALTNQNGVKLVFGSGNYAERMKNWEAFYGEVVREKGIENMRSVDLRFEGQIVAREQ